MIGKGLIVTVAGFGFEFDAETTVRTDLIRATVIKESAESEVCVLDEARGAVVGPFLLDHVFSEVTTAAMGTTAEMVAISASLTHKPHTGKGGASSPSVCTFVTVRAYRGLPLDAARAEHIMCAAATGIACPPDPF
jgi:hypothetical protein